jgi:hypothetical protein
LFHLTPVGSNRVSTQFDTTPQLRHLARASCQLLRPIAELDATLLAHCKSDELDSEVVPRNVDHRLERLQACMRFFGAESVLGGDKVILGLIFRIGKLEELVL